MTRSDYEKLIKNFNASVKYEASIVKGNKYLSKDTKQFMLHFGNRVIQIANEMAIELQKFISDETTGK